LCEIKPARTLHEIYEQDFLPQRENGIRDWREWLVTQWRKQIAFYASHSWRMMPVAVRGKRPVENRSNYSTVNRKWPPLTVDQALEWVSKDFNLAVLGMNKIFWMDIDQPEELPSWFFEAASDYLMMRTPRGLAIPIERDVRIRIGEGNRLKKLVGLDTLRRGVTYELVPLSVTCTKDHGKTAADHRVDFGKHPCIDGGKHDLRVRDWIAPSKPLLTLGTLGRLMQHEGRRGLD